MIAKKTHLSGLLTGFALVTLAACGSARQGAIVDADPAPAADAAEPESPEESAAATAEAPVAEPPAAKRTAEPRPWPHETSDIPVDPRIRFGHFDNGLRWAWASNPEPKERCYVRLHVDVGSLAETDSERGMAHFLEHMAFNGSENFEAGTLVEWFQAHGMSFGADTNAHTSFSETVYKLDLPNNDEKTLREGLLVLRDFADRMLLASEEVEAEKGVIDGEQRERDSAGFRVMEQQLDLMFGGTLIAERLPIGIKEVRDQFSAESVRAFYERWYRPELMTLVAVGDFGDLDPVELFREAFADMPVPEAPLVLEPKPGKASEFSFFYSIYEDEIPSVRLSIGKLKPWEESPVTVAEWLSDLPLNYARSMLNLRFRELAKQESAPFMSGSASSASMFDVFDGESLDVSCTPDKWKEALAAGEQELRRALEHGFRQAELDEARTNALRSLDEAVEREPTAASRSLLRRILAAAENPSVPTSAETRRSIVRPAIEALTVEECETALREAWAEGELTITATGNLDLGEDGGEQLKAVYEESLKTAVEPPAEKEVNEFAYASDPAEAGKVVERKHVDDLDFDTVRFENGVALNVKRTEFREKQIILQVAFGEGQLTLDPQDVLVMSMVAPAVVNGGGLGAHSNDDLRRLTAGKQVRVGFGVGPDRFQFSGATTAEDLLMECEVACAHLADQGWRDEGLVQLRRQVPLMYQQMAHTHAGPARQEFLPALYANDPRFGMPEQSAVEACDVDAVKAWLAPIFADAPIEVTLVGDLDVDQAIAAVAQTFGALPQRREWKRFEANRKAPAPLSGIEQKHSIATQIPKSLVLLAFPTTDGIEMLRRRKLEMLNQVVRDRLRVEVREKLGAAYSPGSGMNASTVHEGSGMLMIQAMSDPDKVDTLVEACLNVADALATDGVTDEEMDRLREPILNQRRDAKRQNGYWVRALHRAQSDANHLDDVRSGDAFYDSVKAADITPLAEEYLPKARASVLVVNPEAKE